MPPQNAREPDQAHQGIGSAEVETAKHIIGTRCANCGSPYFPPRDLCPKCLNASRMEPYVLPERGEIATWTVVRLSKAIPPPYAIAWVDFPDGVRILGRIDGWHPDTKVVSGMPVETRTTNAPHDESGVVRTNSFTFTIADH